MTSLVTPSWGLRPVTKPTILLGEAMGEAEFRHGVGFIGTSGIELLRMLDEVGFIELTSIDTNYLSRYYREGDPMFIDAIWRLHPEVHRTNVFQFHPPGNRLDLVCGPKAQGIPGFPALFQSKYVPRSLEHHLTRLSDELLELDPNLIICLGNAALWALAGSTGISKRRGTTLLSTHTAADFKLLPTYHPAAVLRDWSLRPVTLLDLAKAKREAGFPELRRPERYIWIEPTLEDLETFYATQIVGCAYLAVDIETAGNQITCIGFSPNPNIGLVLPFHDSRATGGNYWASPSNEREAWSFVRRVLVDTRIKKVFQNGLYDIAFLWRSVGIPVHGAEHDTMLLHHALYPESLKSLGFLGSLYTDEGAWKQERKTSTIKRDE